MSLRATPEGVESLNTERCHRGADLDETITVEQRVHSVETFPPPGAELLPIKSNFQILSEFHIDDLIRL